MIVKLNPVWKIISRKLCKLSSEATTCIWKFHCIDYGFQTTKNKTKIHCEKFCNNPNFKIAFSSLKSRSCKGLLSLYYYWQKCRNVGTAETLIFEICFKYVYITFRKYTLFKHVSFVSIHLLMRYLLWFLFFSFLISCCSSFSSLIFLNSNLSSHHDFSIFSSNMFILLWVLLLLYLTVNILTRVHSAY